MTKNIVPAKTSAKIKASKKQMPDTIAPDATIYSDADLVGPAVGLQTDEQVWLQNAQQHWDKQRQKAELAEKEEQEGTQVIVVADASQAPVPRGAGESLLDQSAPADVAKEEGSNDKVAASLPHDSTMNYGVLAALLGGVGVAAAIGGGGGGGGVLAAASNQVSGSVILGPVIAGNGLTVNLYQGDGTTLLGTGPVSSAGTFSINVGSYTGPVIAKLQDANGGNDFMDEATGNPLDLTANLMAVGVANTGTVTLNINALTTVAAMEAGAVFSGASSPALTTTDVTDANQAVASAFGLTDLTGAAIVPTITDTGADNPSYDPTTLSAGEKYGAVLAALSGVDSANGGDMQKTIDDLVAGITVTGNQGVLNSAALDVVIAGANEVADTTNGTGGTLLTAVVSDLTMKVSVSVAINDISIDNVLTNAEPAVITGTNTSGATVTLDIGTNLGVAVTVIDSTHWSYTLTGGDLAAMGVGGETIIATATLPDTSTAVASRGIVVVADPAIYHNPSASPDAIRAVSTDAPVTDITVISSIADFVSLDVSPDADSIVTLSDSVITVNASADTSSARLFVHQATGTVSELNVSASGSSVDATGYIAPSGDLTISAINIEASGNNINGSANDSSSTAFVSIGGNVTLGDFITVTASGTSSDATLNICSDVFFTDVPGLMSVTASSAEANAQIYIRNATGTISGIDVEASANNAYAGLNISNSSSDALNVGDVTVTASDAGATASVNLDGITFNGAVTVLADRRSSDASFVADNASGTLLNISVDATRRDAYAGVSITSSSTDALIVGDIQLTSFHAQASADVDLVGVDFNNSIISVSATISADAWASLDVSAATGSIASITVTTENSNDNAALYLHGSSDVTLGNITVNASGDYAAANVLLGNPDSISGDLTTVDLNASVVAITANGDSADASFNVHNASGIISSLSAVASGSSSEADFEISRSSDITVGNQITVTASGVGSSATVTFSSDSNVNFDNTNITVTSSGASADATLNVEGATGVIGDITAIDSGTKSDGSPDVDMHINGSVQITGTLAATAQGASENSSSSDVIVVLGSSNSSDNTSITFDTAIINVTASGVQSGASVEVYSASGTISSLAVTASGVSSDASISIDTNGVLTISQIDVLSSGIATNSSNDSLANVSISGDVTLGDDITVTASGQSAEASLSTNSNNAVIFTNVANGITVEASGADSSASMAVYNASGTVSTINVNTSGNSSSAELEIYGDGTNNITINDSVSVTATGQDGSSDVTLGNEGDVGVVFSTATVNVEASGTNSFASIDINEASGRLDSIVVTASGESAHAGLALYRSSVDASVLTIGSTLTVSATGQDAYATVDLDGDGGRSQRDDMVISTSADPYIADGTYTLTVGAISVSYTFNEAGFGNAYQLAGSLSSLLDHLHPDAGFVVEANYDESISVLWRDFASHNDAITIQLDSNSPIAASTYEAAIAPTTIAFDNTAISVSASAVSAEADLYVGGATGTIASITVDESVVGGTSSDMVQAYINGEFTITETIEVTASGNDSNYSSADAILNLSGDVFLDGVVLTVTASGNSAEASVDIVNGHGTLSSITVEAIADYAVAAVAISHEVGTATLNVGNINVTATGASAEANLEMEGYEGAHQQQTLTLAALGSGNVAAGVYTLHLNGMTVSYELLASSLSGSNNFNDLANGLRDQLEHVYGDAHLSATLLSSYSVNNGNGAVLVLQWNDYAPHATNLASLTLPSSAVVASELSQVAIAQTDIHLNNSVINITGTGAGASADLTITNATGVIDSITVSHATAGGGEAAASATINGTFTIGDMTVTSSGGSAELDLGNYSDDTVITLATGGIDILVTAGIAVDINSGDTASASLYAENVHGTISTISVVTTGISGDVYAEINGNFTVAENLLEVHAIGQDAEADLIMGGNGSEDLDLTNYDVTLTGMGIDLLASGTNSAVNFDLIDALGTITSISVVANGLLADASANIDFSGSLSGNISVTASGSESSADLFMTAGTPTMVNVGWFDDSYPSADRPPAFAAGQMFTLAVGTTTLSYTLLAGDVDIGGNDVTTMINLVNGLKTDTDYADADFQLLHADNNSGYNSFKVMWKDATAINRDVISLNYDGNNLLENGFTTNYDSDRDGTAITLTSAINITATASGVHSSADIVLDNLVGNISTITADASGGNMVSMANYYHDAFDNNSSSDFTGASAEVVVRVDGSVSNIVINATNIEDRALVAVSQTAQGGTATVSGDGRTALHLGDATVDTVNLAALHTGTWGAFDLNLAMADAELYELDATALTNSMITINNFNGDRDSINLFSPYDSTTNNWARNFNNTAMNYSENEVAAGSFGAFLAAAELALNGDATAIPDYYFGVVGSDGYLAYDMGGTGITGVLKLAGVTSFDAANVGDHDHYMQLGNYSSLVNDVFLNDATRIEYATNNIRNASDLVIQYESAGLIDSLSAHADGSYYGDDSVSLALTEDTNGDIIFRQAIVAVSADSDWAYGSPRSADATLTVSDARGTIERIVVHADGQDDDARAIANFYSFNGAVNEIDIVAGGDGTDEAYAELNMGTSLLTESVQNLWMTVESGDATANLTFASGYVVKTEVTMNSSNDTSIVTLNIEQTVHGGEVFATADMGDTINSNTHAYNGVGSRANFDLTYTGATADKVSLGQMVWDSLSSADVFTVGNFEGAFNLTVNVADGDVADFNSIGYQQTNMLTIAGFDTGGTRLDTTNAWLDDTISFNNGHAGDFEKSSTVELSVENFLNTANGQLDGTTDYYFGVVGSNGYLAMDEDGTGITQVIEFLGMTDLDYTRINGATQFVV